MPRKPPSLILPPPSLAAVLLLPLSVLADGALFWPAACLAAIAAASARHYAAMLVWYGLALGFDCDALILAPFVLAVTIGARMQWRSLALVPGFALAMGFARSHGLPHAFELPWSMVRADQAPLWAIVRTLPWVGTLPLGGLAVASAFGTAAAYVAWASVRPLRQVDLLDAAFLGALTFAVLAPVAAPQAVGLAGALAWLIAVLGPRMPRWRVAVLVTTGWLLPLLGGATVVPLATLALIAAILLHARFVLKPAANDNPPIARVARSRPLPLQRETC